MAPSTLLLRLLPELASTLGELARTRFGNNAESQAKARQLEEGLRALTSELAGIGDEHRRLRQDLLGVQGKLASVEQDAHRASQELPHLRDLYEVQKTGFSHLRTLCYVSLALNGVALLAIVFLLARR